MIQNIKDRLSNGQPVEVWNTESGGYPGGRYAVQFYNGHSYGLWGGNLKGMMMNKVLSIYLILYLEMLLEMPVFSLRLGNVWIVRQL